MGWTVLYIAFGIVALWLLGEVLLQYKARLRWRVLAFIGFLVVVFGVLTANRLVIVAGALAFAVGQTCVTLSFRRGFSTGWALGGRPGVSRRRKAGPDAESRRDPTLEVSGLAYEDAYEDDAHADTRVGAYDDTRRDPGHDRADGPAGASDDNSARRDATDPAHDPYGSGSGAAVNGSGEQSSTVYEPQPMPEDTGRYGGYADPVQTAHQDPSHGYAAYEGGYGFSDYGQQHTGQDAYADAYDYGAGGQQYAAYSDPYVGGQQYQTYDHYDSFGGQQQFAADAYTQQPYSETPPGGVWVPLQRDDEQQPPPMPANPPESASPYGYDPGYNEQQYRY
ncbi:hypothetical protein [Streptomyces sp. MUM 178J]|uniref:hypothetical protein n=1 Tax=Streptomyces sp. MUM 178J TaxID=2791991 RepID=UPI001F04CC0B|nr:hypothetical protein [Streptomyces sp. MUM 178J]WRQ79010.1 hypothetical protein I3F59_006240 [Streptomyces sp. MUM 178J]